MKLNKTSVIIAAIVALSLLLVGVIAGFGLAILVIIGVAAFGINIIFYTVKVIKGIKTEKLKIGDILVIIGSAMMLISFIQQFLWDEILEHRFSYSIQLFGLVIAQVGYLFNSRQDRKKQNQ
jgi:hypothetical protein